MLRNFIVLIIVFCLVSSFTVAQITDKEKVIAGVERAFEKASKASPMPAPGCAVGVSLNGESVFENAFGLAEIEHNIPNTPQTVLESGSVAKQFTAAALVLLQQDGKLKIDDDVRKYIPELPEYDKPITIRHMLNHTAGLRDWGSVMGLTGAGRGDRVITQDIALDVIIRQKALNFTPGAEYSYTNSGYNLAAIIVERVSKQKFGDFLTERIFKPLGMTKSSIRDDYQRLVPGRAQAYSRQGIGPWRLDMPFMNVYGNGGMLTTVGDWLKWNAMLDTRTWNPKLVDELETQGVLNDGRKISYSLGLDSSSYRGLREISHGGATAGYLTWLARFPDRKVSIAVLCNGTAPEMGSLGPRIRDEIFSPYPDGPRSPAPVTIPEEELKKYVGGWKNDVTRNVNQVALDKGELKINGTALKPLADGSFTFVENKLKFVAGNPMTALINNTDGPVTKMTRITEWTPTAAELTAFAGEWRSEEAQASFTFVVDGDKAFLVQRPTMRLQLRPAYKDHFASPIGIIWFTRDRAGRVEKMHNGSSRMRDMPFEPIRK